MSLWWHGLHCRIPVEPPFIICERKQNDLSFLKVLLVNNCLFSRLVTKYNNVLLQFTTARLITAYHKLRQRVITIYHNLAITTFGNCYYNLRRLLLQFTTRVTTHDIITTPANKACVNTNSKVFFRRMTGVLPVKKKKQTKKQFKSHLKNRCPTRPIRQLVCKVGRKRVFSYFDFRSYLKANYPDRFHFL